MLMMLLMIYNEANANKLLILIPCSARGFIYGPPKKNLDIIGIGCNQNFESENLNHRLHLFAPSFPNFCPVIKLA